MDELSRKRKKRAYDLFVNRNTEDAGVKFFKGYNPQFYFRKRKE